MQEYGVYFQKGLLKGLRPFKAGPLDEPMLYECWNLMPTETGLLGHDTLLPIGIPAIGFEYLGIYDQNAVIWYWSVNYDGALSVWNRVPTHDVYEVKNITPTLIPWWIPVLDELDTIWYLYPNAVTGQPILSAVQPVLGESSVIPEEFKIRSIFFEYWTYGVNSSVPGYFPTIWYAE